jgi:hypothetical protein
MVSSGQSFSFPLPTVLADAAISDEVHATRKNGKRLPSWLRYVPGTKSFTVTAMPAGGLPLELSVRIGAQQWIVVIAERAN